MPQGSPPLQIRVAAIVIGCILAAALSLVAAWQHLQAGDVDAARADVEHAIERVEQAEAAQHAPIVVADTDGAP